jgi:hypothetical protein
MDEASAPLKTEPGRYLFPTDEANVRVMGYSHGAGLLCHLLFQALPPGAMPPPAFPIAAIPRSPEAMTILAREAAGALLASFGGSAITNDEQAWLSAYQQGFVEGYRFSIYANPHGLIRLLYALRTEEKQSALLFWFARALLTEEPETSDDATIRDGIAQLQAIYTRYRALN